MFPLTPEFRESGHPWLILFSSGLTVFAAICIASAVGPDALRALFLTTLIGVFVAAGLLLGLVVAQHVCDTHLPAQEESPASQPGSPERPLRQRGFLSLFSQPVESATPPRSSDQPTRRPHDRVA